MRSCILFFLVVRFGCFAQPDSLILADTLYPEKMETIELSLTDFQEQFDTAYHDEYFLFAEESDFWAGKQYLLTKESDSIELALFYIAETNAHIDTIEYFDMNCDNSMDIVIYYSRTDGTSGMHGGFSHQAKGIIIVDPATMQKLCHVEYESEYYSYSQDYDEEKDSFYNHTSECHAYSGQLIVCHGIIFFIEQERACKEIGIQPNGTIMIPRTFLFECHMGLLINDTNKSISSFTICD